MEKGAAVMTGKFARTGVQGGDGTGEEFGAEMEGEIVWLQGVAAEGGGGG